MDLEELGWIAAMEAVESSEKINVVRRYRAKKDCFELPEHQFKKLFRLNQYVCDSFIDRISPFMDTKTKKSGLDIESRVLCALRFFGSGSYQQDIGQNVYVSLSQSSVSRSIKEVVNAVHESGLFDAEISFPGCLDELNDVRQTFYDMHGFPGVVGCLDCTHVAIVPPNKDDPLYPEHIYVNRKNYHSINVQLISDAKLRILSVNSKYPGSTHDSFIWNNCNVLPVMKDLHHRYPGSYYLLGDSGYALRPWLLTPILGVTNSSPEGVYNFQQTSTRSVVERLNGVLKTRFRCLLKHRVLHYHPDMASKIINTCCVLHNMCINNNIELNEHIDEAATDGLFELNNIDDGPNDHEILNNELLAGRTLQSRLVRRFEN